MYSYPVTGWNVGGWPDIRAAEFPHGRGKRNILQVAGEDGVNSRQVKGKAEGFIKKIAEEHESLQSASLGLNLRGMMTIAVC